MVKFLFFLFLNLNGVALLLEDGGEYLNRKCGGIIGKGFRIKGE